LSPQQKDFLANLKVQVAKRFFRILCFAKMGLLDLLGGLDCLSYPFPRLLYLYAQGRTQGGLGLG